MGNGLENLLVGDQLHHEKVHIMHTAQQSALISFWPSERKFYHLHYLMSTAAAVVVAVALTVAVAAAAATTSMASSRASTASSWTSSGQENRQITFLICRPFCLHIF